MGVQYFGMVVEYNGVIYFQHIGTIPDNSELQSYVIPDDDKIIRINIYSGVILDGIEFFTIKYMFMPALSIGSQYGA